MRPTRLVLALAAAALLAAPAARATSYVMVPDEALVADAAAAIVGEVRDRAPAADGSFATDYVVAVERALKGAPAATVRVRVPGGEQGGIGLALWGMPRFATGERVLLFLDPLPARGSAKAAGLYRPTQLLLGAFHEAVASGRRLAIRRLGGAREVRKAVGGFAVAPGSDDARDFDGFADWVAARAAGRKAVADYVVGAAEMRSLGDAFTLFEDPDDHLNLRWFPFDTAGNVHWLAYNVGEKGLSGGGYAELQSALAGWNADAATPVDYRYDGKTASKNGLDTYDTLNTVVFDDPTSILPAFSCATGGVLALGGPWYATGTSDYQGTPYHAISNADVVINDGLSCFFSSSPNASKAAQELFGHELGHTLGIGHSCGDSDSDTCAAGSAADNALMRAYIHDDGRGFQLGSDDRAALAVLYAGKAATAPPTPSNLAVTLVDATTVRLTWKDVAGESAYVVARKQAGGAFSTLAETAANATSFDAAVTPGEPTLFRVAAKNTVGTSAWSNPVGIATAGAPSACVADGQTLCLGENGRFQVRAYWETQDALGTAGVAVPPGVTDSGNLWFFSPANLELLVKVLDACPVNQRIWVFWAATTNVQLTLAVTDTKSGEVRVYVNPLNAAAAPVQDTSAFASCQ